jgi:hypothetical protein
MAPAEDESDFAEVPQPMMSIPYRPPFAMRPPGWIPRPSPYMGIQPRRFYMRCLAWPGPRRLVPASAATAQAAATAAAAAAPAAAAAVQRFRRSRRRR